MPLTPDQLHRHVAAHTDAEGRLPVPSVAGWEIFPFETEGLRVVPLAAPSLPEPARLGEVPSECRACRAEEAAVWSDDHWRLTLLPPSGVLIMLLQPRQHFDLADLPDAMAAEMGRLEVHIARALEALPHVARAHVCRWGDGGAHLHLFFFARPAGFRQLRGSCLSIWDDVLPALPADIREADAGAVAQALAASYGGAAATVGADGPTRTGR
jgi:diadenosine tetraphosphate (Ap4A) HIT family hydrolase